MGSFKRSLLGYRRQDVDAALSARETRISALEGEVAGAIQGWQAAAGSAARAELELTSLAGMVIEREREIRDLGSRLREAEARHERSIRSLEAVAARLDEVQVQARGQATRIRMRALREAVEVSRRAQELVEAQASAPHSNGAAAEPLTAGLFEGHVRLEIGPLADFSQLVGFEDAVGQIGVSEISVERFSEGRATLSMHLEEPVELLRELEERSPLEFRVRRHSGDNLVLDVDEDQGPEQQAA